MQNTVTAWATVLGLVAAPAALAAGLEASTVTLRHDYGDEPSRVDSVVVGAGASFSQLAVNRFNFVDLDPGFTIGGVFLASTIPLFDPSRVSVDGARVSVDTAVLPVADGQQFRLTLRQVPEPATAALLLAGLVVVAGARRQRPQPLPLP